MSFNWAEYLDVAYELAAISAATAVSQEAQLRSSISRAYYAAYKTATNIVRSKDQFVELPTGSGHRQLIQHFRNSTDQQCRAVGSDLDLLLRLRREADYNEFIAPQVLRRNTGDFVSK